MKIEHAHGLLNGMVLAAVLVALVWPLATWAQQGAPEFGARLDTIRQKGEQASADLQGTLAPPQKIPRGNVPVFRAGVAVVDITPQKPLYLDGYYTDRLSTGVHGPLYVKALVLDDGRTRMALVVADAIAYFYQWVSTTRLEQRAVPPENVIICTTHTHSAPSLLGVFGPEGSVDPDYLRSIHEAIAKAIAQAAAHLRPARIGFGRGQLPIEDGEIPHFARNWHNPGVNDPTVLLMRVVEQEADRPLATVINVANHPDVLGDKTTLVSPDFLHYVYERVTRELGGETLVFQRGLGGVEPIPQGVNDIPEAERHMRRISDMLWEPVAAAARGLVWAEDARISVRTTPCTFPLTSPLMLEAYAAGRLPIQAEEGYQQNEMLLVELGPARFLTVPGEPHPEVVFKLVDMMRGEFNFVLGMAQDEIGYVVPAELFNPEGIQELLSSGRDNERVVLSAAARLTGVNAYLEPECLVEPVAGAK